MEGYHEQHMNMLLCSMDSQYYPVDMSHYVSTAESIDKPVNAVNHNNAAWFKLSNLY